MNTFDIAVELLPEWSRSYAAQISNKQVEEFRLRRGQPPKAVYGGSEHEICTESLSDSDIERCVEKASNASVHACANTLKSGYISYKGLRVGVCGAAAGINGEFSGFRSYGSLAVRIPYEHIGVCNEAYQRLYRNGFENTLIAAPPGCGKTTALREIVRKLSNSGLRCGVCDERNELAASYMGQALFELGKSTDVITGINKAEGAMMLLRGMNPQIVAMDEITKTEDMEAVIELDGCGVGLLATAHGSDGKAMRQRALYRRLFDTGIFRKILIIRACGAERRYEVELCT